jgi:hypothetical protein
MGFTDGTFPIVRLTLSATDGDRMIFACGHGVPPISSSSFSDSNAFTRDVYVLENCNRTDCIIPDSTEAPTEAVLASSSSSASSNVGLAVGLVFCK